jgi:hypothetical protein
MVIVNFPTEMIEMETLYNENVKKIKQPEKQKQYLKNAHKTRTKSSATTGSKARTKPNN